jgi:hypothetical protein
MFKLFGQLLLQRCGAKKNQSQKTRPYRYVEGAEAGQIEGAQQSFLTSSKNSNQRSVCSLCLDPKTSIILQTAVKIALI